MKHSELTFQVMVESVPNSIFLVNKEGKIAYLNRQSEVLFGYDRYELIGQFVELLIPKRFQVHHPEFRDLFFKKPSVRAMGAGRELFAARKDGSEFPIEIGLNPIVTVDGTLVLASILDITERMNLLRKQKELEEAKNKELEQFAYIASHDLQEPLRTVSNYVQLVEEEYQEQLDENARKYLNTIHHATDRMRSLVKALLDFSRLGQGRVLRLMKIALLIEDVVADLAMAITESGAQISVGDMPTLYVSEIELRQLFQNLLSNAIKFRKKGVPPLIEISACEVEGKWLFSVKDNGIGIAPNHLNRMFRVFQRLHLKEEYDGHGIGLANCKKIVMLHDGEIWIESTLDVGTTIKFTISPPNI